MQNQLISSYDKLTNAELFQLSHLVIDNIDIFLKDLDVDLKRTSKTYYGYCPIHLGTSNNHAFNIYTEGDIRGNWYCFTKKCHKTFQETAVGFIRGILSAQHMKWKPGDTEHKYNFISTVEYIYKTLGISKTNLKVSDELLEKQSFINQINRLHKQHSPHSNITRETIRTKLDIPATFYKDKYDIAILDKYDIGLCKNSSAEMQNRVVVPIYDENYKYMVGCTGRTTLPQCNECNGYHNGHGCNYAQSKWLVSKGTKIHNYLYNYWFAKKYIKNTNAICLVESPGNVWKLVENGVNNVVAICGTELSNIQYDFIIKSGALYVNLLFDNDAAGQCVTQNLKARLWNAFNVNIVSFDGQYNDISDMSNSLILSSVIPQLKEYKI